MTRADTPNAQSNPLRGEATLTIGGVPHRLRPTFTVLVAAEEELGPLLALVDRAGAGQLRLAEIATLFWHCLDNSSGNTLAITRDAVGAAVVSCGLAEAAKPLRVLLSEILKGAGDGG